MKFWKENKETIGRFLLSTSKFTVILGYFTIFCVAIYAFVNLEGTIIHSQGYYHFITHSLPDYIFLYSIGNFGIVFVIFTLTDIFKTYRLKIRTILPRILLWILWIGGISLVTLLIFFLQIARYDFNWNFIVVPLFSVSIMVADYLLKKNRINSCWAKFPREKKSVPILSWAFATLNWGLTLFIVFRFELLATISTAIQFPITFVVSLLVCSLFFSKKKITNTVKIRPFWVIVLTSFSITGFIVSNSLMFKLIMDDPLDFGIDYDYVALAFCGGFIIFGFMIKIGLQKMYEFVHRSPINQPSKESNVSDSHRSDGEQSILHDTVSIPEKIFCPNCSTLLIDGDTSMYEDETHIKFCPKCGFELKFEDLRYISKESLLESHRKTIQKIKNQKKVTPGI